MKNLGFLAYLVFVVLLTLKGQIMAGESSGESAKNTVAWFSKPTLAMMAELDSKVPAPKTARKLDRMTVSVPVYR